MAQGWHLLHDTMIKGDYTIIEDGASQPTNDDGLTL